MPDLSVFGSPQVAGGPRGPQPSQSDLLMAAAEIHQRAKRVPVTETKPFTGWGGTKGVPMPTSPYGADFSSDFKMTPDFKLDLKAKDWKATR